MSVFYTTLTKLCASRGVKLGRVLDELNISRSNGTAWREGKIPKQDKLSALAGYFDVFVDYLLGSSATSPSDLSDRDIQFALFGDYDEITDELFDDVKAYARFRHEQKLAERKARKKEQEE